jgi:hypothetical protein
MTTIEEVYEPRVDLPVLASCGDFAALTRPLIGLRVALARQGYGSALTVELGQLTPASGSRRYLRGEASFTLEWNWRFEMELGVAFGSSSSNPFVYAQLAELRGQKVTRVYLESRLPELVVELSGGLRAHSLACVEGDPQWCLRLPDSSALHWGGGALRHEPLRRGGAH